MYFLLANMHEKFHLLSYGLAIILVFIGTKMLLIDVYKIPVAWSLGVTASVLVATMLLSLYIKPKDKPSRPGTSSLAGAPSAKLRAAEKAAGNREG
jgi:tellurite resistance protein TerC